MGGHTQSEGFLGYSSSLAMAVPCSSPPVGRGHGSILQPKLTHSLLHLRQIPNYCCLTQSAVCTCVCVHTCVSVHLCECASLCSASGSCTPLPVVVPGSFLPGFASSGHEDSSDA